MGATSFYSFIEITSEESIIIFQKELPPRAFARISLPLSLLLSRWHSARLATN